MVPDGFVIRSPTLRDRPSIDRLLIASKLAQSGPPTPFKGSDAEIWLDPDYTRVLIATPSDDPSFVVAHACVTRKVTACRASRADLEDVATHPGFEGKGLSRAILGRLFWWAQNRWECTRIEWVSADIPERQKARRMYEEVIGAELEHGTNANFRLKLPWQPGLKMAPHFVRSLT